MKPAVLFLCVHNAFRSQMGAAFLRHLGGDGVTVFSGGSEPGDSVSPAAIEAMAEVGIDLSGQTPRLWEDTDVRQADAVVRMGCGDVCPVYPGKRYLDWELDDTSGDSIEEVRRVRDDIRRRVEVLMAELGIEAVAS
jgi:protein-tyrosine-phosphatase